jgi:excisionase family DNA binding protein
MPVPAEAEPTRPHPPHRKLTPKEAAAYLGIPQSRLDRWRREGRLPYLRLTAKSILYRAADLYEFEDASRIPARPVPAGKRKPKNAEHRRAIAAGQKAAWARRKASVRTKDEA